MTNFSYQLFTPKNAKTLATQAYIEKQTNKQTNKHTDTQTNRQVHRQRSKDRDRQTDRQTDRHTDRDRKAQTDRQTDRWTDRQKLLFWLSCLWFPREIGILTRKSQTINFPNWSCVQFSWYYYWESGVMKSRFSCRVHIPVGWVISEHDQNRWFISNTSQLHRRDTLSSGQPVRGPVFLWRAFPSRPARSNVHRDQEPRSRETATWHGHDLLRKGFGERRARASGETEKVNSPCPRIVGKLKVMHNKHVEY